MKIIALREVAGENPDQINIDTTELRKIGFPMIADRLEQGDEYVDLAEDFVSLHWDEWNMGGVFFTLPAVVDKILTIYCN